MSIFPHSERASQQRHRRSVFQLDGWSLGCGRTELHICKVKTLHELGALWPWLREQCEILRQKNPPRTHWLHEHLLLEITKGLTGQTQLECFVAHRDTPEASTLHGMLVAHPLLDPWNGLPLTWYVWLCTLAPKMLLQLIPEFEELARQRFYLRWEWSTSRPGWERRAALFGAKVVEYRFGKEL